jgi:putative endonuclease
VARKNRENRRIIGSRYEEAAAAFLKDQGYEIVERNYRDRQGEIDLIARDGPYLVFVEVKYRKDTGTGYPEEAVHGGKQKKIRRTASYYMYSRGLGEETPCRFDVVAITGSEIRVIRNAF